MAVAVAHIINDMKAMVNAMILHMMMMVYRFDECQNFR
jgi:hypothetical protein